MVERELSSLPYANLHIIIGHVTSLCVARKTLAMDDGQTIPYDRLCICTGATPKVQLCSAWCMQEALKCHA